MAYLKVLLEDGQLRLGLLNCKTRVWNDITIAQGELMSLLNSVALANKIQAVLGISKKHFTFFGL